MPIKVTCWQARETGYTLAVVPQRHTISVLANEEEMVWAPPPLREIVDQFIAPRVSVAVVG